MALISSSLLVVTGTARAQKIAAGDMHSVAIKSDGTVWAWGDNTFGQLGLGYETPSTALPVIPGAVGTPTKVLNITNATKVVSNGFQSLALTSGGTVWGWGWNGNGPLGDGTTVNRPSPVQIPSLSGVTSIAMGTVHAAATTSSGALWTWGSNHYGQLGDGTNTNRLSPYQILSSGVASVSVASNHSMALKTDGTVITWGYNPVGQLGDGTRINRNAPVPVSGLAGVIAVAAGDHCSLALKADGSVWMWGAKMGEPVYSEALTPVQITGLSNIISIAAGDQHAMARKNDGTLWIWGWNSYGQLGNGTVLSSLPQQLTLGNGLAIEGISPGKVHSLALDTAGNIWSWGVNDKGQLGDVSDRTRFRPEQVIGESAVGSIALGASHSLAVKQDGSVRSTGLNDMGQLGLGDFLGRDLFTPLPGTSGFVEASGNNFNSLLRKGDGTVWGTGYNYDGNIGDGTTIQRTSPVQASSMSGAISVSAGYHHSVALKQNGTVWAWGSNYVGQLGDGTGNPRAVPTQLTSLSGITAVAAGSGHTLALKSDGTVWAWGHNADGQLGNGTFNNSFTPVQVNGLTNVIAIKGGTYHSMALKSDGSLWSWGSGYNGQLGNGGTLRQNLPVRTGGTGFGNVKAIAAGKSVAFALKTDGTVWGWGDNGGGQLGDGTRINRLSPVQISGADWCTAIITGESSTLALKADGTLLGWGFGANGELSESFSKLQPSPATVFGFNLSNPVPTLTITSPAAGTVVSAGSAVNLSVSATPGSGTISKVYYFSRGVAIGESSTSPFSFSYTPASWGRLELNAIAVNSNGVHSKPFSTWVSVTSTDVDNDGLPDSWETTHFGGIGVHNGQADPDGDGLTNLQEYQLGGNPNSADGDNDGLPDAWEAFYFNSLAHDGSADNDGDFVNNATEYAQQTNPASAADGNANGIPDDWELAQAGKVVAWPPALSRSILPFASTQGNIILKNGTGSAATYSATVTGNVITGYGAMTSLSGGPAYAWEEISVTGTRLATISSADDTTQTVPITGFTFPFGSARSQVHVSSNGLLSFDSANSSPGNMQIPGSGSPNHSIAVFWDDLNTNTSGDVYSRLESNRLIIQYQNVARHGGGGTYTFQAVLHSDGRIDLRYKTMTGILDQATIGVQRANGTDGIGLTYNAAYVANNLAVRITPNRQFFTLGSLTGSIPAGGTATLPGQFQSFNLTPGVYGANVAITHNGSGPSPLAVSANLTVLNRPSTVNITSPAAGNSVLDSQSVEIIATASDPDGLDRVEFYDGTTLIDDRAGSSGTSTYTVYWNPQTLGTHTITVKAIDSLGGETDSTVTVHVLADGDYDGMADVWEIENGLDPDDYYDRNQDADGDGFTNLEEYERGLDPQIVEDTDSDGMPDGWEFHNGLDPGVADGSLDRDNDGLTNLQEYQYGTNPRTFDTDGDLLPDLYEIQNALDPLVSSGEDDIEPDGLTNLQEFLHRTDPNNPDTDGDGVSDGVEVAQGSDPTNAADGGNPPPDPVESIEFKVGGDYASWRMEIKSLGPRDTRTLYVVSPAPGTWEVLSHKLWKNNGYEITMHHTGSRPQDNPPWYCWEGRLDNVPNVGTFPESNFQLGARNALAKFFVVKNHWLVDNRDGLLTAHLHSEGVNHVVGKKAYLRPVEVVNASKLSLTKLKVGKMSDSGVLTGSGASTALNIDNDPDRFLVRVLGGATLGSVSLKVSTANNPEVAYDDDTTQINLVTDGGNLISQSMLMVSDDVDDDHVIGGVADDATGDRTHKVQLGGNFKVDEIKIGTEAWLAVNATTPVPVVKKINCDVFVLKIGTTPVRTNAQVQAEMKIVKERFAQVGVKFDYTIYERDQPAGVNLSNGLSVATATAPTWKQVEAETKSLIAGLGTVGSANDVQIFYVNQIHAFGSNPRGAALADYWFDASEDDYINNVIVGSTYTFDPFNVAHELGHLLTDDAHHANSMNLMMGTGTPTTNTLGASKRLDAAQETRIMVSDLLTNP